MMRNTTTRTLIGAIAALVTNCTILVEREHDEEAEEEEEAAEVVEAEVEVEVES